MPDSLKLDFNTDVNFALLGDTMRLAAKAFFHRQAPVFLQKRFHSKHFWWDDEDKSMETRSHIEGIFSYEKTNTSLRVAIDEIQNYIYYGMSYNVTKEGRNLMTNSGVFQETGNINILTAQAPSELPSWSAQLGERHHLPEQQQSGSAAATHVELLLESLSEVQGCQSAGCGTGRRRYPLHQVLRPRLLSDDQSVCRTAE